MPKTDSAASMRVRRARAVARGYCTRCLKDPSTENRAMCQRCLDLVREGMAVRRANRIAENTCTDCGKEKEEWRRTYRYCATCNRSHRSAVKRMMDRRRSRGDCTTCGIPMIKYEIHIKAVNGIEYTRCPTCTRVNGIKDRANLLKRKNHG